MTTQQIEDALAHAAQLVNTSQGVVDAAMTTNLPAALAGSVVQHHHLIKNIEGALKIAIQVEQAAQHVPFLAALPYMQLLPLLDKSLQFIADYVDRAANPPAS